MPRLPYKQFRAIGQHDILEKWSEAVRTSLIRVLRGHDWRCFYPIRIGYTEVLLEDVQDRIREHYPVVLLVALADANLAWESAIALALACRGVLRDFGIEDVEVELLEGDVVRLGSSRRGLERLVDDEYWTYKPLKPPLATNVNKSMLPVLPHLGYHIVQAPAGKGGTMGLHLRLGSDKSRVYGLTSRHVAVASRLRYDVDFKSLDPPTSDQDSLDMTYPLSAVQLAFDDLKEIEKSIHRDTKALRFKKGRVSRHRGRSCIPPSK